MRTIGWRRGAINPSPEGRRYERLAAGSGGVHRAIPRVPPIVSPPGRGVQPIVNQFSVTLPKPVPALKGQIGAHFGCVIIASSQLPHLNAKYCTPGTESGAKYGDSCET